MKEQLWNKKSFRRAIKKVGFTAYIWQENAITTLTPLDKKKQNSFHPYNLSSSKTWSVGRLCTTSTEVKYLVYRCVDWEKMFFSDTVFLFFQGAFTNILIFLLMYELCVSWIYYCVLSGTMCFMGKNPMKDFVP